MSDSMSQVSPEPGQDEERAKARVGRAYRLVELIAVLVLVGALLWLMRNYQPRGPIGRTLLNYRIWVLVLLVSAWGTAGSLIPYYVGQRGTKAVFDHYPKLEGRPWERLEGFFRQWGAFSLILSGIPLLGAAFLVAAGAVGIGRPAFLCWVFLGKVLRNWVVAFVVLFGLQLVG